MYNKKINTIYLFNSGNKQLRELYFGEIYNFNCLYCYYFIISRGIYQCA